MLVAVVRSLALDAQVTPDRLLRAADEPQNWLTYSGGYASQRHSLLKQIEPGNVKNLELKWILPNQVFGAWQSSPLVVERHHVCDAAAERRARRGREDRPRVLAVPLHRVTRRARLLRRQQPRRRDPRRHAVHGHARRAPRGPRREDRPPAVECGGRRSEARLLDHDGAARRQGQGPRRRRRRRVPASAASSPPSTRGPARRCGASTRSPDRASPATRRGRATRGRPAADRFG